MEMRTYVLKPRQDLSMKCKKGSVGEILVFTMPEKMRQLQGSNTARSQDMSANHVTWLNITFY